MSMDGKHFGKKGRPEHGRIARVIRRVTLPRLWVRGFPLAGIILNEKQMSSKLGYESGKEKGGLVPDIMVCSRYVPFEELDQKSDTEIILIEIGNYIPDKWGDYSVIHIGFNKQVTPISKRGTNFELETIKAIEEALTTDLSYSVEGKTLDKLRDLVLLCLSGIGLTTPQIANLCWNDLIQDEDHYHARIVEGDHEEFLRLNEQHIEIITAYRIARFDSEGEIAGDSQLIGSLREKDKEISIRAIQKAFAQIYGFDTEE